MQSLHISTEVPTPVVTNVTAKGTTTNPLDVLEQKFEQLKTYLTELSLKRDTATFAEHECVIAKLTHELGCNALSIGLSQYDVNADIIRVGKQIYRKHVSSNKTYQSIMGPIEVERNLYINRKQDGDGKTICPLDLQAGIIESYWTPEAAKHSAWTLAHLTPQETEDLLLRLGGMSPSRSSLERLPKALQNHWQAHQDEYYDILIEQDSVPKDTSIVATSLDGVMIAMKPEKQGDLSKPNKEKSCDWREASCGTISFFNAAGERLSTIQYGQMPEHKKATLKQNLVKHIEFIKKQHPKLHHVSLADGAQDNWCFFEEHLPLGFELTDFYHGCQYLKTAFNAAYKNDAEKAQAKFAEYRHILRDEISGVQKVLRALRHLRSQHKDNEDIETALTFFKNNQHRMKYAEAKEKNYPIGSGVVEAACKTLVGQRLKRSGMSWCHHGGQAILTLRSLAKSRWFDNAWQLLAENYRVQVHIYQNRINYGGQTVH